MVSVVIDQASTVRPQAGAKPAGARRDEALDMVKGMLVVAMMVIHASNLFVDSASLRYWVYPVALGFVSGSWIFISGFLVTAHYQSSFDTDVGGTSRRLWARGLRLLAIFLFVNLLLGKISLDCPDGLTTRTCQPWQLLVLGDNVGMTFEILQGIAYVLLVAPLYMSAPLAATACVVLLVTIATIGQLLGGSASGLSWMILVGMVGLTLGWYVPAHRLRELVTEPRKRLLAITVGLVSWGGYQMSAFFPAQHTMLVALYTVGVAGMLLILYAANGWIVWRGLGQRWMNLMARYALLCYMGQMAILQAWRHLTDGIPALGTFAVSFAVGMILLVAGLEALDNLRRRVRAVDRAYQFVLG